MPESQKIKEAFFTNSFHLPAVEWIKKIKLRECATVLFSLTLCLLLFPLNYVSAEYIAHWKFDEGSGLSALDASGNGNTGTLVSGQLYSSNVPPATFNNPYSLDFNGSAEFVSVPLNVLDNETASTITAWIRPETISGSHGIFARGDENSRSYIYLWDGALARGSRLASNGLFSYRYTTDAVSANTWTHIAATVDPVAPDGSKIVLYINGSVAPMVSETWNGTFESTDSIARIGQVADNYGWQWSYLFDGQIDDLRIFDRALSAAEVASIFAETESLCDNIDNNNNGKIDDGCYSCKAGEQFTVGNRVYCFDFNSFGTNLGAANTACQSYGGELTSYTDGENKNNLLEIMSKYSSVAAKQTASPKALLINNSCSQITMSFPFAQNGELYYNAEAADCSYSMIMHSGSQGGKFNDGAGSPNNGAVCEFIDNGDTKTDCIAIPNMDCSSGDSRIACVQSALGTGSPVIQSNIGNSKLFYWGDFDVDKTIAQSTAQSCNLEFPQYGNFSHSAMVSLGDIINPTPPINRKIMLKEQCNLENVTTYMNGGHPITNDVAEVFIYGQCSQPATLTYWLKEPSLVVPDTGLGDGGNERLLLICNPKEKCPTNTCGNGTIETGELCDDGNTISGDGCSSMCAPEGSGSVCGDGVTEGLEQCDDGNTVSGDGCSAICANENLVICGNGTIESGEQCDDGNTVSGDGCSATCVSEICGDGDIQSLLGEQCDDGNTTNGDGCSATCQTESVGGNGEIVVNKIAVNGDETFYFEVYKNGDFSLPDSTFSINTLNGSGEYVLDNLTTNTRYTIMENTPPANWTNTNNDCDFLEIDLNQLYSCNVTNVYQNNIYNTPPEAINLQDSAASCSVGPSAGLITFSWMYDDMDGDVERGFQLQIDNDPNFVNCPADINFNPANYPLCAVKREFANLSNPPGTMHTQAVSVLNQPPNDSLEYGVNYYWRVGEWQDNPGVGGTSLPPGTNQPIWFNGNSFSTPATPPPYVDFSFNNASASVIFTSTSACYDGNGCDLYSWNFGDNEYGTGEGPITHQYATSGTRDVTLTVSDNGTQCYKQQSVNVPSPSPPPYPTDSGYWPGWREKNPFEYP